MDASLVPGTQGKLYKYSLMGLLFFSCLGKDSTEKSLRSFQVWIP